jgi:hypothetical protein
MQERKPVDYKNLDGMRNQSTKKLRWNEKPVDNSHKDIYISQDYY